MLCYITKYISHAICYVMNIYIYVLKIETTFGLMFAIKHMFYSRG